MRVWVYVDGFNLYYRALRKGPHKWVDLQALSRELLDEADEILGIRYFTARISPRAGDPESPRRQQLYLSALGTVPDLHIHYGRFMARTKWRPVAHPLWSPHVKIEVNDTEEKGSDVNLATHLLNDAWHDRFDAALVYSQDTDLEESLRIVSQELQKAVGLVCLDGREPNRRLARWASFVRHVTPARLAKAQFPDTVIGATGKQITKPNGWK
ncbi:NYN domain-containing protein [Sphingomonas lenta]|uniref:Uncharacterized protein n=1 Tax=Sphingomonas lenta TaxID=1141887 RepID=A0A2A2SC76_9SPHN|nr:NYN domain-containing protein [Sphingomonas lenta]PAX06858.1 hypothetical protein CKY28_12315 [Sphingomonas lenta]